MGGATWAMRRGRLITGYLDDGDGARPATGWDTVSHHPGFRVVRHDRGADVGSVRALGRSRRVGLLDLLFGLVAGTGPGGRADGTTDHGPGRPGHGAADQRAGGPATDRTGPGSGFVIALGGLTGDRATDSADRATDDGARRATDGHPDGGTAKGAGPGAQRLGPALLVLRRRAVGVGQVVMRMRMVDGRVVVHVRVLLPGYGRLAGQN
jgi:hypothetical protein